MHRLHLGSQRPQIYNMKKRNEFSYTDILKQANTLYSRVFRVFCFLFFFFYNVWLKSTPNRNNILRIDSCHISEKCMILVNKYGSKLEVNFRMIINCYLHIVVFGNPNIKIVNSISTRHRG